MKLLKKVFVNLLSYYIGLNLAVFIYGWFWTGKYKKEHGDWPTKQEFLQHLSHIRR